jgi:hypothetical protein
MGEGTSTAAPAISAANTRIDVPAVRIASARSDRTAVEVEPPTPAVGGDTR